MTRAALLLVLMWLNFALLTANFRAIAQARYVAAILTDVAIAICGWTLFRLIAESQHGVERVAYVIGAALGSATGIYLTRRWGQP
jgi:hypothetical protein